MDTDLTRARAVLDDIRQLPGIRYDAQPFAEYALTLMRGNWPAVEALATELIAHGQIEGDQVERIIDRVSDARPHRR